MNDQELNSLGIPKPKFKKTTSQAEEFNSLGIPTPKFKKQQVAFEPQVTGVGKAIEPAEVPESLAGPAYTKLPTQEQYIPGGQQVLEQIPKLSKFSFADPEGTPIDLKVANNKLQREYAKDVNLFGEVDAKLNDVKRKQELYDQAVNYNIKLSQQKVNSYIEQRIKELQPTIKTQEDVDRVNKLIRAEAQTLIQKLAKETEFNSEPQKKLYEEATTDKIYQTVASMNPEQREEFKRQYKLESEVKAGPFFSSLAGVLTKQIPAGMITTAADVAYNYDEVLAQNYKRKYRLNPDLIRQRGGAIPPNWEEQQKQAAVQERISEVGQAQYEKEKQDYQMNLASRKEEAARKADILLAGQQGLTSQYAGSSAEIKDLNTLSEYIAGGVGQVIGFGLPSIAAGALTGGTAAPFIVGAAAMAPVQYKEAKDEGMKLLQEKYPELTREQIFQKDLDQELRSQSFRSAITTSLLESAGNLFAFGKFIPKNKVSEIITKVVDKITSNKVAGVAIKTTLGSLGEGFTELLQKKDTRISALLGVNPNMTLEEATRIAFEADDTEDFLGGMVGAGPISLVSNILSTKDKKKNQIETIINRIADTGNEGINQQIDNEANDQEGQVGVPSVEQQVAENISDQEYNDFVDKGTVSPQLISSIADKVKANETLSARENAIFTNKTAEINNKIRETTPVTPEQPTTEVTPEVTPPPTAEQPVTKQPVVEQPVTKTPVQGDVITLPPQIKGGMERKMTFDKGLWKQNVGGELTTVSYAVHKQAQEAFNSLTTVTPEAQVTPTKPTFETGQKVFTISQDGKVIGGTVKRSTTTTRAILLDDNKIALRANAEVFDTQQQAEEYLNKTKEPVVEKPAVKPEETLTITTAQELQDLMGEPTVPPVTVTPVAITPVEETPVTKPVTTFSIKNDGIEGTEIPFSQVPNGNEAFQYVLGKTEKDGKVGIYRRSIKEKGTYGGWRWENKSTAVTKPVTKPVKKTVTKPVTEEVKPVNLNDYKRYFFNKFPKSFPSLATAMEMSELGWQKAARTFSKNATPEELKMLEALGGKKVEPVVTPEVDTEQEAVNVSAGILRKNGYSQQQIDMMNENPDRYMQIDNTILDMQTDKVVPPAGKKVTKKPTAPVKYKKTQYKDLVDLLTRNGSSIKSILEVIAGLDTPYADMAKAMLSTYDKSELIKLYSTTKVGVGRGWLGMEFTREKKIVVNIKTISNYYKDPKKIENRVISTTIHEISHAFTSATIKEATGVGIRKRDINKLKNYLKHGSNPNVKTLIKLYLSTREQLAEKGLDAGYPMVDIYEFIAGSFNNSEFQAILNDLKSPINPNVSIWKQFIDAVKKILGLEVKTGSMLESVMATTPNLFIIGKAEGMVSGEGRGMAAPSPARVLGKIANELIDKGMATAENAVDKVAEYLANNRIDLPFDVYDYADKIAAAIKRKTIKPTEGFDAAATAKQFFDEGSWSMGITEESPAAVKAAGIENAADFLRDKVKSKDDVAAFAKAWNAEHLERPISQTEVNDIWSRIEGVKPERETQTVFTDQLLKDLFAKWSKGKTQGIMETQAKFRELLTNVQETFNKRNLTPAQVKSVLAALKRVNRFSVGTFSRLNARIQNILDKVNYAEKLQTMANLRNSLKAAVKSKTKLADLREVAKGLLTIDVSYLDQEADIDTFIRNATAVVDALSKLPEPYKIANISEITDYINDTNDAVALAQVFEITGQNDPQMENEAGNELTETQQARIDQVREMAEDSKASLDEIEAENAQEQNIIDVLKEADLDTMTYDDQVMYIRVVDNFVTNRGYSLLEVMKSKIKAGQNLKQMAANLSDIDKNIIAKQGFLGKVKEVAVKGLFQITQIIDAIYGNNLKQAEFYRQSGLFDYAAACARREDAVHKMGKAFSNAIDDINKKYERRWMRFGKANPRKNLREESEQIKLGMLAEFAKFFLNSEEHIDKIKLNIEATINNLSKIDKERADLYRTEYDKVKDNIRSAQDAIRYFQQNEPHVHALWKWMRDNMFTDDLYNRAEKNTKAVYNRLTTKFENYLPTRLRVILKDAVEDDTKTKAQRLGPVQSSHTKQARRVVPKGFGYSFDNYITEAFQAYEETLHDIETAPHYLLFKTIANRSEEFNEITSGDKNDERNRQFLIAKVKDMDQYERNKSEPTGALYGLLSGVTESIKSIGVASALGGPTQAPLQWIPTMVATAVNLGKDVTLLFARPFTLPKEFKNVLNNYPIVVRGQPLTYDLKGPIISSKDANALVNFGNSIRSGIGAAARWWTTPMTAFDTNANRLSFVGFYLKSLRDQGETVNWRTEHLKEKEESRQKAFAYATMMTNNLQTSSATAEKSQWSKEKGVWGMLRNVLFPFSSFAINSKIVRTGLAYRKLMGKGNKGEGLKELTGIWAEVAAFLAVKAAIIAPYKDEIYDFVVSLYEGEEGEEPEEDELKKIKAEFVKEINPTSIGVLNPFAIETTNYLNYLISDVDIPYRDFLQDEEEEKAWKVLTDYSKFNPNSTLGLYGITPTRLGDLYESSKNYYSEDEFELQTPYGTEYIKKDEIPYWGLDETIKLKMFLDALAILGLPPEIKSASDKAYRQRIKELRGKD